jgi:hypothetical protein
MLILSGYWAVQEKPARIAPGGRCRRRSSVALAAIGTGPDEAAGLCSFVMDEVGVDRRAEARIVELDREVVAALGRALRPTRTYLHFLHSTAKQRAFLAQRRGRGRALARKLLIRAGGLKTCWTKPQGGAVPQLWALQHGAGLQ